MRFSSGIWSRIDEVTPSTTSPKADRRNVSSQEYVNRRSLFHGTAYRSARKDLAVYASLSSNRIVKEPASPIKDRQAAQPIDLLFRPQQAFRRSGQPHCLSGKPNSRAEIAQAPQPV
jgi:hypothetical protein